ncbi:MAG TPA: type II secretion system protein GspN [Myxococcota bacterium]|nr:type II secretion system protein GspN [Myxococcota bacterium]
MPLAVKPAADAGPLELPRWVRTRAIPLGAALLTLLFVVAGFPFDRLAPSLAARVSQGLGAQVSIASVGPSLSLLGPGVRASGVSVAWPDGSQLRLDSLRVRPAWSFAWLRGRPALALRLAAPLGQLNGTLTLGSESGFDGALHEFELAKLPLQSLVPGASIDGKASGDLDITTTPGGARGSFHVEARDGSLGLPNLPFALPYTMLRTDVRLTDAALAEISSLELDGPLLSLRASGSIGRAALLLAAPLNLSVRIQAKDSSVGPLLAAAGLRMAADGSADLRITGTAGQPLLR